MEMPVFYRVGDCISLAALLLLVGSAVYLHRRHKAGQVPAQEV